MTTLYGISNCDTVKKARQWLEQHGIEHSFHDFRKDDLSRSQVETWVAALGWENLVNKRSTTWKGLGDETRQALNNDSVVDIILAQPTLIKRPLLEQNNQYRVGFKAPDYEQIFA